MKIVVGADHAGFSAKEGVVRFLEGLGHDTFDVGTHSEEPVDFPDIAGKVADHILRGEADRGVMVCGTGVGAAIAANKIPGIRASLSHDTYTARQGVEHDDVNVLCMGAWLIGPIAIREILEAYLAAEFSTDEAFRRRVDKLAQMDAAGRE